MAIAATTLNGAINGAVTALTVRDAVGFASSAETDDVVLIDSEWIRVTAGMGTTAWTVTRGYSGSTAAAHSDGATVYRIARSYTDLVKIKTQGKITGTTDDSFLLDVVEACNAWMTTELHGIFLGPSLDTSRSFDLPADSRTLFIPGGVRSVTTLQIRDYTGGSLNTIASSDFVLRPQAWQRLAGMTTDRIEFVDGAGITGSYSHFNRGYATAVVTSTTFGPAEVPADLERIATTVGVWLHQSRATGSTGIVGSLDTGELVVNRVLTPFDNITLSRYRNALDSFDWVAG